MDIIYEINKDLLSGFSKSDLENLIGLPQNSLSGVLTEKKKLSKKSRLKIERWVASEKPDPLNLVLEKRKVVKKPKEKIVPEKSLKSVLDSIVEMPANLSKSERFKWMKDHS
jgi:hypothetical protein